MARALHRLAAAVTSPMARGRQQITLAMLAERLEQRVAVPVPGRAPLSIACNAARALHDPLNFGKDEPETIAWINSLPPGGVYWDIGANIGLYAVYAAAQGQQVLAFEPSAASFAALMRNVEVNGLGDQVAAYCLAFADETKLDALHMSGTAAGHSMHSFGGAETIGGAVQAVFRQAVPGFTVDAFRALFGLPAPDYIKMDVDGLEPAILRGAEATLPLVRAVLVEIDGNARDSGALEIRARLEAAGLREQPGSAEARNVVFARAG